MGNGLLATLGLKASAAARPDTMSAPPAASAAQLAKAIDGWRAASERVDGEIARLQSVLKKSNDEDLRAIAEFGLNALTANHKVRLMAVLQQARGAEGDALRQLAAKGLGLARDFKKHVDSSEQVAVVDANPFGVKVAIRPTLSPALAQLAQAFEALQP